VEEENFLEEVRCSGGVDKCSVGVRKCFGEV